MGKRRRSDRAPKVPMSQIREEHFRLLKEYGRNDLPNRISKDEQQHLWQMMCQGAGLPAVPRDQVFDAWKAYIGGQSEVSSIAINGDIDPRYTTLGITYQGKLTAAHTTRTPSLLKRVMLIFAKSFGTRTEFLLAAERLCKSVAAKAFPNESAT